MRRLLRPARCEVGSWRPPGQDAEDRSIYKVTTHAQGEELGGQRHPQRGAPAQKRVLSPRREGGEKPPPAPRGGAGGGGGGRAGAPPGGCPPPPPPPRKNPPPPPRPPQPSGVDPGVDRSTPSTR